MAEPLRLATPTGDTHGQSALDKTLTTFHRFPWLPTEIRLKIWKLACFPRSETDRGIQYVTVNIDHRDEEDIHADENMERYDESFIPHPDEEGYITLTAPKRPRKKPAGVQPASRRPNASACLWDAGLQMACKESKLALTEYYDFKGWLEIRDQSKNTKIEAWYMRDYPSALIPHKRDKKWCPMVVPVHDIFCIDMSRIQTLPRTMYSMTLLAPFFTTRTFTVVESWNIALKFNGSWNRNFPSNVRRLMKENTPRGMFASWLDRFFGDELPESSIWIIDDSVAWLPSPEQDYTTVYRDCDGDYIQVDWDDIRDNGAKGDISLFMKSLGALWDYGGEFTWYQAREIVKLLVRKDNELSQEYVEEFELNDDTEEDSEEGS
ncbi:hypothetical protein ACHAP5_011443 [Fusarium lateritium]